MGTAGQPCTTLRRLFVHENVYDRLVPQLAQVYAAVKVGDPRQAGTLVGPLIDLLAFESMQRALAEAREAGGNTHGGERIAEIGGENAYYARPALCEMPEHAGRGGREASSDAWKAYMRRATNAINFGTQLPLPPGREV